MSKPKIKYIFRKDKYLSDVEKCLSLAENYFKYKPWSQVWPDHIDGREVIIEEDGWGTIVSPLGASLRVHIDWCDEVAS